MIMYLRHEPMILSSWQDLHFLCFHKFQFHHSMNPQDCAVLSDNVAISSCIVDELDASEIGK